MMTTTMTMVMMNHKKFLKKKKINTKLQHLIWNKHTEKKLISNEEQNQTPDWWTENFLLVFFRFVSFYTSQKSRWNVSELELDCWWKKRVEQRKKKIGSQIKKDTRIPPYVERERNTLGLFVDDNDDDGKYCGWFDGSVIIITVIMLLPFESNRIKLNYRLYHFGQQNQIGGGRKMFFFLFRNENLI